jgi:hypothetical protein
MFVIKPAQHQQMLESQLRFVRQQGYSVPAADGLYEALMLQPRITGCLVVVGTWFQSAWMFLALSGALWLATALPEWNVFNAIYNTFIAYPLGLTPLRAAPPPRRFAMGMAAAFALAIGAALGSGATTTAWILEGLLAVASWRWSSGDSVPARTRTRACVVACRPRRNRFLRGFRGVIERMERLSTPAVS